MDFERIEIGIQIIVKSEYKEFRDDVTRFRRYYQVDEIPKLIDNSLRKINQQIDRKFPYPSNVTREENKEMEILRTKYINIFKEYADRFARKTIK